MRGRVVDYNFQTSSGVISGSDGGRYVFRVSAWRSSGPPAPGMVVDFVLKGANATSVYAVEGGADTGSRGGESRSRYTGRGDRGFSEQRDNRSHQGDRVTRHQKSKATAAVLAALLGWTGAHKFYLGYTGPGLLMVLLSIVTLCVASRIIAAIEFIIYLSKTDDEFQEVYVRGHNPWF